jgi:hypothetical protein
MPLAIPDSPLSSPGDSNEIEKTCTIIQQLPVQKLLFEKIEVYRDDEEDKGADCFFESSNRGEPSNRKALAPLSAVSSESKRTRPLSRKLSFGEPDSVGSKSCAPVKRGLSLKEVN